MRDVIGIKYHQKISSNALYEGCECDPMSVSAAKVVGDLFGDVMRMVHDI